MASMEPLNRYICRVSDACSQWIHYKLSATFSDKYHWPNFTCSLGWCNPMDSLVLYYIARTPCAMPWPTWHSEAVWRCWVGLLWLKIVSVEVKSQSKTPSLRLRCRHRCGLDCVRTIFTTFYHNINHYAATGHVVKFSSLVAIYFSETVRILNREVWHRYRWIWKMDFKFYHLFSFSSYHMFSRY